MTPFEHTKQRPYSGKLVPFGTAVWFRIPGSTEPGSRVADRWVHGIYVGNDTLSDEFIGATSDGIMRTRTIRHLESTTSAEDYKQVWTEVSWSTKSAQRRVVLTHGEDGDQGSKLSSEPQLVIDPEKFSVSKKDVGTDSSSPQVQDSETQAEGSEVKDASTEPAPKQGHDASTSTKVLTSDQAVPAQTKRSSDTQTLAPQTGLLKRYKGDSSAASKRKENPITVEEADPRLEPSSSTGASSSSQPEGPSSSSVSEVQFLENFLISVDGPPWYDSVTGKELSEAQVEKGMNKELESLQNMDVYVEVPEAEGEGHEVINSRWVLSQKDPETTRCRVVAQQLAKNSLDDTFASTSTPTALRLILFFSLVFQWQVAVGDVSTAFLHAVLPDHVQVFVKPPVTETRKKPGIIWKLKRALYGLRHSPKYWAEHLRKLLIKLGWTPCVMDPSLFYRKSKDKTSVSSSSGRQQEKEALRGLLSVHTDDIVVTGTQVEKWMKDILQHVKINWHGFMNQEFTKYLGKLYRRGDGFYEVAIPTTYWDDVLSCAEMQNCKASSVPGEKQSDIEKFQGSPELNPEHHHVYRQAIGKLMWAASERPDLQFSIKELSRRASAPTLRDWKQMEKCLKYLKGTREATLKLQLKEGFKFDLSELTVDVTTDADWPSDKPTSGVIVQVGGFVISTASKTQQAVALSSCESEFVAISEGCQAGRHVAQILEEVTGQEVHISAYTDSNSALKVANRRGPGKLKHVSRKFFWIQELVQSLQLQMKRVPTTENTADLLTKYLPLRIFKYLTEKVGMIFR